MSTDVTKPSVSPLTSTEKVRLDACEKIIDRGMEQWLEVGQALLTIRDDMLYRETHARFDEYVRVRWNMGKSHAYRLIQAACTVEAVSPIGDKLTTESAARELAKAPERQQKQVLQEAVKATNGNVTAQAIAAARKKVENTAIPPMLQKRLQHASAEPDDDDEREPDAPWSEFNAAIHEIQTDLRGISRRLGDVLGYDTQTRQMRAKWARRFTHAGTVGIVNALIRSLSDNIPAEYSANAPGGYLSGAEVDARRAAAKK